MQSLVDYIQNLNVLAVVVAALVAFVTCAVWYSQAVFGKMWAKEVGIKVDKKPDMKDMAKPMLIGAVTVIISAVAVGVLVQPLGLTTALQGASFGILLAVGLVSTNKLMAIQFEGRSWAYFWIVTGADVLALGLMGAILATWR